MNFHSTTSPAFNFFFCGEIFLEPFNKQTHQRLLSGSTLTPSMLKTSFTLQQLIPERMGNTCDTASLGVDPVSTYKVWPEEGFPAGPKSTSIRMGNARIRLGQASTSK